MRAAGILLAWLLTACGSSVGNQAADPSSPLPSPTWSRPPHLECESGAMRFGRHSDFGIPREGFEDPPDRTSEEKQTLAREAVRDYVESQPYYPGASAEELVMTAHDDESITFTFFEGARPRFHVFATLQGRTWTHRAEAGCVPLGWQP